jgi:hypothetical protein
MSIKTTIAIIAAPFLTEGTALDPKRELLGNIEEALSDAHARARTRTLNGSEAATFLETVATSHRTDRIVEVRAYGGFVPNSYAYRAEADRLTARIQPDGAVEIFISRDTAPKRARGFGSWLTVTPSKLPPTVTAATA